MPKKKFDGISFAIVILNILIVGVIITLCVLIYLYMSGKLEQTDVANLGQEAQSQASISTTAISPVTLERTETTTFESTVTEASDDETTETAGNDTESDDTITAVDVDFYDIGFFSKDLFIGDSISTGLQNYGYMSANQVFAKIGLNPESAMTDEIDGYTSVSFAEKIKPKRIYIMLGSNGLAYMGNTYMIQKMELLIMALKQASPESFIYVISIPPVTKAHESEGNETMAMINGYNKMLKDMSDEIGVVFLDLCAELENSSGYFSDIYAEADGMHFLGTAYRKMLSFIQKSIQD